MQRCRLCTAPMNGCLFSCKSDATPMSHIRAEQCEQFRIGLGASYEPNLVIFAISEAAPQQAAELMEKWPGESNALRFCSRKCLDEYKLEILKKETVFCISKSVADSCLRSAVEGNMTKRRVCENNEKRRKRHKEPRPHPSYRLNKRYWDDIRAGRRVHDVPSFQPQQRPAPANRGSTVNLPTFSNTIPHLSFPLINTAPALVAPCVPYPFSSVSSSSFFADSLAGTLMPKTEPEDIIDVTSFDDKNVKTFINPIEKQKFEIQTSQVRPRESDLVVDQIADEMFKELVRFNRGKECEKVDSRHDNAAVFMPIPVPIPMPILIPLSDAFILKYFNRAG
uniref:Uncharacterized protein n=1 Tax=Ascaris lumbricoides TaxID=6252 RepID=A0A0M3HZY9_ASCLU